MKPPNKTYLFRGYKDTKGQALHAVPQKEEEKERAHGGVRQDKKPPGRFTTASNELVTFIIPAVYRH